MKVKMVADWGGYKKDQIVPCSDADGCRMINTGVARPEELDRPEPVKPEDRGQKPEFAPKKDEGDE